MLELSRSDVLVDLCTQREYFDPSSPRCCRNASHVLPNLRRLMALARWARLPVLSCVDARRPNQIDPGEFSLAMGNGDPTRRKAPYTLLPRRMLVESDNCLCVPLDLLKVHRQTIFTKYHRDPFTNPKLDRLLTEMPAGRFVAFGAPLETSLRILVLGLMRRGRSVVLLEDACGFWSPDEAAMVLRQLSVKGASLLSTNQFVETEYARLGAIGSRRRQSRGRSVA